MKVLFVSSGNAKEGISLIIRNQGKSLLSQNVDVEYFAINGKSIKSYLKHIFILRHYLKKNKFDIIHAHYSLSAFVASLAQSKPLIVSLMGSDVNSNFIIRNLTCLFSFIYKWEQIIVKSEEMKNKLIIKRIQVIPNGVDLNIFKPLEKSLCQEQIGWDKNKSHILFAANPKRKEKNFKLASESISIIKDSDIELHFLENVSHNDIPKYMNASDVLLLCSLYEGSPNVIKEAMACNCKIVTTNVGDVRWVLGETCGCYISSFKPEDVADNILKALKDEHKTKGRDRIIELDLNSQKIAQKIANIYNKCKIDY